MVQSATRLGLAGAVVIVLRLSVAAAPAPDTEPPTTASPTSQVAELPESAQITVDFARDIRPIFARHCFSCHAAQKQENELRLDRRDDAFSGGISGPAFEPGNSGESLLIEYVAGLDPLVVMPPKGPRLSADEIAILRAWIDQGAPWPDEADAAATLPFTSDDYAYWAFQPVPPTPVPDVKDSDWVRNPIDAFILARLEESGLAPAPQADRRTLIRRATFDLLGLPPTPEEVEAFLNDSDPNAYEKLIDRLLASPHYGERWARHWLDLVRYAESNGYKLDEPRPHAWRYRDWVICSLNEDKPYDRFLAEQLAGDEIAPDDPNAVVATGYLRHWPYESNQADIRQLRQEIFNDITDVTGEVFFGLTIRCARCHDHKYDPILQRDYYRLQAFFAALELRDDFPLESAERVVAYERRMQQWNQMTRSVQSEIKTLLEPYRQQIQTEQRNRLLSDIRAILDKPAADRTSLEQQLAFLAEKLLDVPMFRMEVLGRMKPQERQRWDVLEEQLTQYEPLKPEPISVAMAVGDVGPVAPPTYIPGREQTDSAESGILPGHLSILDPESASVEPASPGSETTGRRRALARWLTDPDNPLTTRVMVNRLWQYHFVRGIVATPSDFGRQGEPPTHPELLDWLAREFVARGWSLKAMHRLMMTSATYRQASAVEPSASARQADPDNHLLWRMRTRRLEAEELRDAMLATSGELNPQMGGPSVRPELPVDESPYYSWTPTADIRQQNRRSIYLFVKRNLHHPLLSAFDAPDTHESCPRRNVTTTAPQALTLINGRWSLDRARAFAGRLLSDGGGENDPHLVEQAYRLAYGRLPDVHEQVAALTFLDEQSALIASRISGNEEMALPAGMPKFYDFARAAAFVDFCHVLLNSNEFLYVD